MSDDNTPAPKRRFDPRDLVGAAGLAFFAAGCAFAWPPAGLMVIGLGLIAVAYLSARRG